MTAPNEKPEMATNQAQNVIDKSIIANYMPSVLDESMKVLNDLHPNASYNCKANILLAKTVQMVSCKRIKFKELKNVKLINHFAINLMSSGLGKDRICDDIDKYFLKYFVIYFKDKARDYLLKQEKAINDKAIELYTSDKDRKNYIREQMAELRAIELEVSKATPEGFFEDAKTLEKAGFGSIFIKISEFGLHLQSKNAEKIELTNMLYEAYDGKVSSKSIKYGKRENSVENMPVNALLHSDYTLFKSDIKGLFTNLMAMGLARRAFISFQHNNKTEIELNPQKAREIKERAYSQAEEIGKKLFALFLKIPENAIYEITTEAYETVFYPYCIQLNDLYNQNVEDELLSKEIKSRELKVLKLAGMYASLNHPTELIINENDVQQAINTVELLSKDFAKFKKYSPKTNDGYFLLYDFLRNADRHYKKTELIERHKDFGFSRDMFRREFDDILQVIMQMAEDEGYYLLTHTINNNSGKEYYIFKPNPNQVNTKKFFGIPQSP